MLSGFEWAAIREANEGVAMAEASLQEMRTDQAYKQAHHDGTVAQMTLLYNELKRLAPDNPVLRRIRATYNEAVRASGRKQGIPAPYIEQFLRKQNS